MKTDSLTRLLKNQDRVKLSTVKANKILVAAGILEAKERPSSKYPGKIKTYKALTEKGLEYGLNIQNPSSPEQTTPYYYVEKFEDLLSILEKGISVDEKKS